MYALAILRYRRPLEEIVAATDAHRAYLRDLAARGIVLAAGGVCPPMTLGPHRVPPGTTACPMWWFDPRAGGALLLRVPDEDPQRALDAVRDGDPFWTRHHLGIRRRKRQPPLVQYELLPWAPAIGKDALDRL
jgi:hypothetical protein